MRDPQTSGRDRPTQPPAPGAPPARWLSPRQAAEYVGVSLSTLRRYRDAIGPARLGGRVLYDVRRLDEFVEGLATGRGGA